MTAARGAVGPTPPRRSESRRPPEPRRHPSGPGRAGPGRWLRPAALAFGLLLAAGGCGPAPSAAVSDGGQEAAEPAGAAAARNGGPGRSTGPGTGACRPAGALTAAGGETRGLTPGGCHLFTLPAARGDLLEVAVTQLGADVVLELEAPSGDTVAEVDSPFRGAGPEVLVTVLEETGRHLLRVRAFPGSRGRYRVGRAALRPADDVDRRRACAHARLARAEALRGSGDRTGAEAALVELAPRVRALGDPFLAGEVAHRRALLDLATGRDGAAARRAGEAAAAFHRAGDVARRAQALDLEGQALFRAGRTAEAADAFQTAADAYRDPRFPAADLHGHAVALHNLGHAWQWQGHPQRARDAYRQAIALARRGGAGRAEAESRHNLGTLLLDLDRPDAAAAELSAAVDLWRDLGEPARAAVSLDKLGAVLLRRDDPRAVEHLRQVLELRDRAGDPRGWAVTASQLALAWRRRGQPLAAVAAYRSALAALGVEADPGEADPARRDASLPASHRRVAAVVLHNLALVERELLPPDGQPPEEDAPDLARLRRSLALHRGLADDRGEAAVRAEMARGHRLRGELEAARGEAERALDLHEAHRARPNDPELRSEGFATVQEHYDLAVAVRMDLHRLHPGAGHAEAALGLSERSRARTLLDLRLEAVREGTAPTPAEPLSPAEIRRRLAGPGTGLLVYDLGADGSHLWVVGPSGVASFPLAPRRQLEEAATRAAELLALSHRGEGKAALERALCRASRLLLQPAAGRLAGVRRLVVVGDGALAALPFAALPEPRAGGPEDLTETCRRQPPLLAARVVTQPPSATLAALVAGDPEAGAETGTATPAVAVFADPVYAAGDPRLAGGMTTDAESGRGEGSGDEPRRLPATVAEAAAIRAAAERAGVEVALHLGPAATPGAVTAAAPDVHGVLHLAVHGTVDLDRPEASALLLSRFTADGKLTDGRLTAGEIRRLPLRCDLVVLSACRTGLGRRVRGEGMMGLGRAFLAAGADRALVTLWPVDDAATARLMARFYRHLLVEGLGAAEALAAAQRSLAAEAGSAPYHWAGFVLQG